MRRNNATKDTFFLIFRGIGVAMFLARKQPDRTHGTTIVNIFAHE